MKTTCDLCLQPQPLLWPGEKNLCPDCFRGTKDLDDMELAEMIDEPLGWFYSQIDGAEAKISQLYSQIEGLRKIAERKEMEVFA